MISENIFSKLSFTGSNNFHIDWQTKLSEIHQAIPFYKSHFFERNEDLSELRDAMAHTMPRLNFEAGDEIYFVIEESDGKSQLSFVN